MIQYRINAYGVFFARKIDENFAGCKAVDAVVEAKREGVAHAVVDLDAAGVPVRRNIRTWVAVVAVTQHGHGREPDLFKVQNAPLGGVHVVETQIGDRMDHVRNLTKVVL